MNDGVTVTENAQLCFFVAEYELDTINIQTLFSKYIED